MSTHPRGFFSGNYISAVRECYCLKFFHRLQPHKLYIQSDLERRRVASSWALPHVPSLYLIFASSFLTGLLGFVWFLVLVMFSFVSISQVICSELWVFCTSQVSGYEDCFWNYRYSLVGLCTLIYLQLAVNYWVLCTADMPYYLHTLVAEIIVWYDDCWSYVCH